MKRTSAVQIKLTVMMALQLAIWGAWAPKIFPYMSYLGFSPAQQGAVGSAWGVASVAAILFSNSLVDRRFAAERFMAASHLLSGLALTMLGFATSFPAFLSLYLIFSFLYVPTLSVANVLAFSNLEDSTRGFGQVRAGGTIGWVLVSWPLAFLLSGTATGADLRYIFWVAAAMSFALAGFSLTLPHTPPQSRPSSDVPWAEVLRQLRRPVIAVLFFVTFLDSVVHNGYFVMADAFLTKRVGIADNLSMIVLSIGQIAEIVTMIFLGHFLVRLGWRTTMIVGVAGHAVRYLIFANFADHIGVIIAAQLLHGICYAFFFATLYIFVSESTPKHIQTSCQGLFNLVILGIGSVVASYIFPALEVYYTRDGMVDYGKLFVVPAMISLTAGIILLIGFFPDRKIRSDLSNDQKNTQ